MRNYRYILDKQFQANSVADDLRIQLRMNRMDDDAKVTAVENRNEVLVQVHVGDDSLEEVVSSFMDSYNPNVILE
ncbi:hypothetical protein CVD25_13205 [Bacillus canaveralius]|uniref:Uncharacterized protein n=1 Tax=Bacillus canaveralius TaxID=1403243 RepID=A0A2N5GGN3_9BACI|nr:MULTISPECIES: hypothetical protein [Bacillus]PLR79903.1 hypothetical protein CU635_20735 [Bacillus canaveralius]PLR82391.1 hypothetical protein CVD23_16840 [Bacillus sp. V33-4]PLR96008.1 hypothetical protein CVD25_13205 [Bacillus canaveralius]RSK51624.1 hypothetical protein EJA13_14015 [Bacillus canaveralius]